jgi:hypothetical protein
MSGMSSGVRTARDPPPGRHLIDPVLSRVPTDTLRIALLIVAIALVGALASWRASVWAGDAARDYQRAAQERILEGQISAGISSEVAHHRRLWQAIRARLAEAVQLEAQARVLGLDRGGGRALHQQAQAERAAAEAMRLELGPYRYSALGERLGLEATDPELRVLKPDELEDSAGRAHDRKRLLVILYICFVASVVALTFAVLREERRRRVPVAIGTALSMAALLVFVLPVPAP